MRGLAKRVLITLVVVFIGTGVLIPQAKAEGASVTVSTKVLSQYLGSDGAIFHDKPVLQTDVFIQLPRGVYIDFWHSVGLDGTDMSSDYGDEIDYTLGWSGTLKGFVLDTGVSYFELVELLDIPQGDVIQPYIEVSKGFNTNKSQSLTPYFRVEFPFPAKGSSPEKGILTYGGLRHTWQGSPMLTMNQEVYVLRDDGAFGFDSAVVGQYHIRLSWNYFKRINIDFLSLDVSTPLTSVSDADGRKTEVVVGGGLTFNF